MTDLRVLLVEDSTADAELTVELLREGLPECAVTVAARLSEALAAVDAHDVDVALVGLSLPDAEGLQAVLALRREAPGVAVVVLTGDSADAVAERTLAAGAEDCLVKSDMTPPLLARAVRYARSRTAADREVRRSRAWAQDVLDSIEAPTCALDATGTVVAVNAAWDRFAAANGGDPGSSGVGVDYLAVCRRAGDAGDVQAAAVADDLLRLLRYGTGRVQVEYACHGPGVRRWFTMRATPVSCGAGAVITHLDVTDLHTAREELRDAAMHDPLTGLPNRRQLFADLRRRLASAGTHRRVAVLFLDLDRFKVVNDTYGHGTGDALLVRVAAELSAAVRAGDLVVRHAGDEFVVVATVSDDAEASALADRVQAAVCQTVHVDDHEITLSASQGLAVSRPGSADGADVVLAAADSAMHEAKDRGRGRVEVFSDELRRRGTERVDLQRELQRALDRDELVLHYQPIVDGASGDVRAVEALVRWDHPQRGLLPPAVFLDIAESSGLIVPIGERLVALACRQARRWHDAGHPVAVSVNLSARQLGHRRTVSVVEQALRDSGLDPAALVVEVTETSMIDDTDTALSALAAIKALGVRIAVDDFGTGYSSLAYLKRYPVDIIKVDRSFVHDMLSCADDHAIVASVVALAAQLELSVVAEGVETDAQRAAVDAMGCRLLQGYLFDRPRPADRLGAALRDGYGPPRAAVPAQRPVPRADRQEVVDPAVLARMTELARDGASLHSIAAALNAGGMPHPRGLRWHPRSVARCLPDTTVADQSPLRATASS